MRATHVVHGRDPRDLSFVLWRTFNRLEPALTIAGGRLLVPAGEDSEYHLRLMLQAEFPSVWEAAEEWCEVSSPPPMSRCGRLYCQKPGHHEHRKWAPGDVFADCTHDPKYEMRWPFPMWGVLESPVEDDGWVDAQMQGGRRRLRVANLRRLRPDEIGGPQ